jgi:hypothetical protein
MANPKDRILHLLNQEIKKCFGLNYNVIQNLLSQSAILITGKKIQKQFPKISNCSFQSYFYFFIDTSANIEALERIHPDLDHRELHFRMYSNRHISIDFADIADIRFNYQTHDLKNDKWYHDQNSVVINYEGTIFIDYQKLLQKIEFQN